jgi:glutamate synthase (NADPH/NADH) large chain
MMRKCHLNTCPVGVATQDPILRQKFTGQPEHVVNYFFFIAQEVRELMAQLGVRTFEELVGRADLLDMRQGITHWKARGLDFSKVFHQVPNALGDTSHQTLTQDHGLSNALDQQLIAQCAVALNDGKPVSFIQNVRNLNRSIGAMLSGQVARRYGHAGLPEDTIHIQMNGTAGQSFGAFLAHGVTFDLVGEGNDYVGKGLSGGRIIVRPDNSFRGVSHENIIVGNTVLYGAISGAAFFSGMAGERFAVRNSGATAVVEGTGDHGCEYMTGGTVVVLGETGRNFAAGMSGGVAYVYDPAGLFAARCNTTMVGLSGVLSEAAQAASAPIYHATHADAAPESDEANLKNLIEQHFKLTGSMRARAILDSWSEQVVKFIKVMPTDYERVLIERENNRT